MKKELKACGHLIFASPTAPKVTYCPLSFVVKNVDANIQDVFVHLLAYLAQNCRSGRIDF